MGQTSKRMGDAWVIHGPVLHTQGTHGLPIGQYYKLMSDPWATHERPMAHGQPLGHYFKLMGDPWATHGQPIGQTYNPWAIHGPLLCTRGQPMGNPWATHGPIL